MNVLRPRQELRSQRLPGIAARLPIRRNRHHQARTSFTAGPVVALMVPYKVQVMGRSSGPCSERVTSHGTRLGLRCCHRDHTWRVLTRVPLKHEDPTSTGCQNPLPRLGVELSRILRPLESFLVLAGDWGRDPENSPLYVYTNPSLLSCTSPDTCLIPTQNLPNTNFTYLIPTLT